MRVYLRGLVEQSEIRVSGPLRRDHYRGGPVFFSAGSVTRYAASSKFDAAGRRRADLGKRHQPRPEPDRC